MHAIRQYVLGVVTVLLLAGNATAVVWLDFQDGTAGQDFTGWTSGTFGGFANPPGMTFTEGATWSVTADTTGDNTPYAALFSTGAFAGDMTNYDGLGTEVAGMSFDFTGGTPSGLGFYFQSDDDAGSVWFYDLPLLSGAGRHDAPFSAGAGWYGFTDNTWDTSVAIGQFDAALGSVTDHGMFIYFNQNQDQTYGLGDFGLTVPEPETYMILGMALLSVALVFRKQISDSLVEARAMLQV